MIKTLVKKQLMEIFRSYYYDTKKNKARTKTATMLYMALFVLLMVGALGGTFGFVAFAICSPLVEAGMDWLYFALMSLIAVFLGAFGSVFNTYSGLYLAKDNDLLLSMPIPVGSIIVARLLGVYLMGLMYSGIVFLPSLVIYWIFGSASASSVFGGILMLVLISVIVLLLSCLLGWVVAKASVHLKNKSFTTVAISLGFIVAYYVVYFKAQTWIRDLVANAAVYGAKIKETAFPVYVFGAVAAGDWAAMGTVTLIIALAARLTWLLLSRSFLSLATASGKTARTAFKMQETAIRSVPAALFAREMNHFTASPNYMLNCGLGTLLIPALGVFFLLKGQIAIEGLEAVTSMENSTAVLMIAAICLVSTMNDMAAPSVALEGKSLWLAQSLPVTAWQVLLAKLKLQLALTNPPVLLASLCCLAAARPGVIAALGLLLIPQAFSFLMACLDLAMGLSKPNLSWTSEIVPIKQSFVVAIALFGGFILAGILGGGFFLGGWRLGVPLYLLLVFLVLLLGSVLLCLWLKNKGTKVFEAL